MFTRNFRVPQLHESDNFKLQAVYGKLARSPPPEGLSLSAFKNRKQAVLADQASYYDGRERVAYMRHLSRIDRRSPCC